MAQKYGDRANETEGAAAATACLICDDPRPSYSWTDYSGEGYCTRCGTVYQLQWGELREGETYPRINIRAEAIPMFRRYWQETGAMNGTGTFMSLADYPEKHAGRKVFSTWWAAHKEEYPELCKSPRKKESQLEAQA